MRSTGIAFILIALCSMLIMTPPAWAVDEPEQQADAIGRTPPRLSLVDGQVSYWRTGAKDWVQAQVN